MPALCPASAPLASPGAYSASLLALQLFKCEETLMRRKLHLRRFGRGQNFAMRVGRFARKLKKRPLAGRGARPFVANPPIREFPPASRARPPAMKKGALQVGHRDCQLGR